MARSRRYCRSVTVERTQSYARLYSDRLVCGARTDDGAVKVMTVPIEPMPMDGAVKWKRSANVEIRRGLPAGAVAIKIANCRDAKDNLKLHLRHNPDLTAEVCQEGDGELWYVIRGGDVYGLFLQPWCLGYVLSHGYRIPVRGAGGGEEKPRKRRVAPDTMRHDAADGVLKHDGVRRILKNM